MAADSVTQPAPTQNGRHVPASGPHHELASTSSGLAWSQGRADNAVSREMVLAHLRELVAATDLPVNADFENGFGTDAATVAEEGRFDGIAGAASGQELNERFGKDAARRG